MVGLETMASDGIIGAGTVTMAPDGAGITGDGEATTVLVGIIGAGTIGAGEAIMDMAGITGDGVILMVMLVMLVFMEIIILITIIMSIATGHILMQMDAEIAIDQLEHIRILR